MLDYYTFDGKRLDRIGVKPDILCEPKDALNIALNEILKEKSKINANNFK
jgi:C-terminal processing protease CtpA/Prc